jgi:hypothetical protein
VLRIFGLIITATISSSVGLYPWKAGFYLGSSRTFTGAVDENIAASV